MDHLSYNSGEEKTRFRATSVGGGTPNAGLTIKQGDACMTATDHYTFPYSKFQYIGGAK